MARFVILEGRCLRVNHLRVPLCPEVQLQLCWSRLLVKRIGLEWLKAGRSAAPGRDPLCV